jgi:antibiotic biosynthesis monooxygenase (ABM) superfamily enzyme
MLPSGSTISSNEGPKAGDSSVTVVVARLIKAGCETAFESWLHDVARVATAFPGHLGLTVIRPESASRRYVLIFRFDTVGHLEGWERSRERAEMVAKAAPLTADVHVSRLSGMEAWFALPGGGTVAPPARWKMALIGFAVAFPLIQVLNVTIGRWLAPLPVVVRGAATGATMIVLMTYGLMPLVTRLLSVWLYPPSSRGHAASL